MPRRRAADGAEGGIPAPKTRVRKKKDSASVCGTPTGDPIKIEQGGLVCPNQMQMESNNPVHFNPQQMQNIPPHPSTIDGPINQPPMGTVMPPFGPQPPQPHPEFIYGPRPPQHPGPFLPMYGMPQNPNSIQQMPPHMPPHSNQFGEQDGPQQFIFHPQHSPSQPAHVSIPQTVLIRQPSCELPVIPPAPFLEFRFQEINRRLYSYSHMLSNMPQTYGEFWDAFASEFFDDSAKMTIIVPNINDNVITPRKFSIGRSFIPKFYRKIFDSGVNEMHYTLRTPVRESVQPIQPFGIGVSSMECDNLLIVTKHDKPIQAEVHTECRLYVEFAPFDQNYGYRIQSWVIYIGNCQEYFRHPLANPHDSFKKVLTNSGLPPDVFSYLNLCTYFEPMKMLMDRSKALNITPREALEHTLFEIFYQHNRANNHPHPQHMMQQQMNPPISMVNQQPPMPVQSVPSVDDQAAKKPQRKRQRKNAATTAATTPTNNSPRKGKNSGPGTPPINVQANFPCNNVPQFNPTIHGDPRIVDSPSLMGYVNGPQSDERSISRIENLSYFMTHPDIRGGIAPSPNTAMQHGGGSGGPPPMMVQLQQQQAQQQRASIPLNQQCNPSGMPGGMSIGGPMSQQSAPPISEFPHVLMNDFDMNAPPQVQTTSISWNTTGNN